MLEDAKLELKRIADNISSAAFALENLIQRVDDNSGELEQAADELRDISDYLKNHDWEEEEEDDDSDLDDSDLDDSDLD